jgi:peptide-methionine (S)-S-oxide reductase
MSNINNLNSYKNIVFGGGCFWGVQHYFSLVKGVVNTKVGYANGKTENPTYRQICQGNTGHTEVCLVEYDKDFTKLEYLIEHFLNIVDTTTLNKQGNDVGTQYRSGIYYENEEDKNIIFNFLSLNKSRISDPFVTEILPLNKFWEAEEYHQEYLDKNPGGKIFFLIFFFFF